MKSIVKIFAVAFATGLSVQLFAAETPARSAPTRPTKPQIEVCFVLDTTGSMGGLIDGAKQKIWSIANEVIAAKPTPSVRFGLIGYRDRGDEYVTKVSPLTDDLDAIYADLRKFTADGGGDAPESVSEALDAAVRTIKWSKDRSVLKIIYLVGDAPPHTDYADGPNYKDVCAEAARRDLIINTVQCGNMPGTREVWTEIARKSEGQYVALAQTGNMIAVATPFDKPLADLNVAIGKTIVAYGAPAAQAAVRAKQEVVELAAFSVAADRLSYNAKSGGKVVQGSGELIDALKDGSVVLGSVKREELPEDLKKLSPSELKARLDETAAKRSALQKEANELGQKRDEFIAAERKRLVGAGKGDSFDTKVAEILREQAAKKGIGYDK
jgi:Mg-chelatase subunit ChlD